MRVSVCVCVCMGGWVDVNIYYIDKVSKEKVRIDRQADRAHIYTIPYHHQSTRWLLAITRRIQQDYTYFPAQSHPIPSYYMRLFQELS